MMTVADLITELQKGPPSMYVGLGLLPDYAEPFVEVGGLARAQARVVLMPVVELYETGTEDE